MKTDLELENTKLLQFIVHDRYSLLRHTVLLLAMLAVIFYSNWQYEYSGTYKYYRLACVFFGLLAMCYVNMFVLVPLLFFRGRYLLYLVLLSVVVFLFLTLIAVLLDTYLPSAQLIKVKRLERSERGFYEGFIILIPIILVTTMIKLFQRWTRDNERIGELKNIAFRMELNELRNQINPHFLFNMLNGIKALVRSDPEKATLVIMKLSEFLRYQIYENNEEKTPLLSEITFLSNFLSLEMLRRDQLSIDVNSPANPASLNGIYIPPNLFTTFVENAVKHSVDVSGGESYIKIKIEITGNHLEFSCTNSKDTNYISSDQKNSGLGLANIKRRLALLYGETYVLDVNTTEDAFSIILKFPI
ncbi:MAG: histidine kinase [Bacteroidota bacterium]